MDRLLVQGSFRTQLTVMLTASLLVLVLVLALVISVVTSWIMTQRLHVADREHKSQEPRTSVFSGPD